MSQSLIHQVSVSEGKKLVLLHLIHWNGLNPLFIRSQFQRKSRTGMLRRSLRSQSLIHQVSVSERETGFAANKTYTVQSQSLIHQVSVSEERHSGALRHSPAKSQSLIHQVSVSELNNLSAISKHFSCLNPLFIRSQFQSTLKGGNTSCNFPHVSIPYSSGLSFRGEVATGAYQLAEKNRLNPLFIRSQFQSVMFLSTTAGELTKSQSLIHQVSVSE